VLAALGFPPSFGGKDEAPLNAATRFVQQHWVEIEALATEAVA
jgi:hypothetical protein